jgi:hypothetical protein
MASIALPAAQSRLAICTLVGEPLAAPSGPTVPLSRLIFRLAGRARLRRDPVLAVSRMRAFPASYGVAA